MQFNEKIPGEVFTLMDVLLIVYGCTMVFVAPLLYGFLHGNNWKIGAILLVTLLTTGLIAIFATSTKIIYHSATTTGKIGDIAIGAGIAILIASFFIWRSAMDLKTGPLTVQGDLELTNISTVYFYPGSGNVRKAVTYEFTLKGNDGTNYTLRDFEIPAKDWIDKASQCKGKLSVKFLKYRKVRNILDISCAS